MMGPNVSWRFFVAAAVPLSCCGGMRISPASAQSSSLAPDAPSSFVQLRFLNNLFAQQAAGGQPTDVRGTVGNLASGLISAVAPGSCVGDLLMTGYKNDLYDEDDYGFQPTCMNKGGDNRIMCFPGGATVESENRGTVQMNALKKGERILAWDEKTKQPKFEEVSFFLHEDPTRESSDWVSVKHTRGELILSSTHMALVAPPEDGKPLMSVAAKRLTPHSKLVLPEGGVTEVLVAEALTGRRSDGIFAPVTPSGTLFVDGVLASSFSSLDLFGAAEPFAHKVLNRLVAPLRAVAGISDSSPAAAALGYVRRAAASVLSAITLKSRWDGAAAPKGSSGLSSILTSLENIYLHSATSWHSAKSVYAQTIPAASR